MDDFKDGEILEDFSTCEKFPRILDFPRQTISSLATIAFHMEMSCTICENVHPYAYYYGMHTAFPCKIWEAIGGYYTYNEVYDG
jgi:hypothetical protein